MVTSDLYRSFSLSSSNCAIGGRQLQRRRKKLFGRISAARDIERVSISRSLIGSRSLPLAVLIRAPIHCLRALSETEPRGQLEGARAARAEDRTDPVIGLPK